MFGMNRYKILKCFIKEKCNCRRAVLSCDRSYYSCAVIIVGVPFPFGVQGRIWNSIVSVPNHCLFIYFTILQRQIFASLFFASLVNIDNEIFVAISAWASTQSDQSLCCLHEETMRL